MRRALFTILVAALPLACAAFGRGGDEAVEPDDQQTDAGRTADGASEAATTEPDAAPTGPGKDGGGEGPVDAGLSGPTGAQFDFEGTAVEGCGWTVKEGTATQTPSAIPHKGKLGCQICNLMLKAVEIESPPFAARAGHSYALEGWVLRQSSSGPSQTSYRLDITPPEGNQAFSGLGFPGGSNKWVKLATARTVQGDVAKLTIDLRWEDLAPSTCVVIDELTVVEE